MNTVFIRT